MSKISVIGAGNVGAVVANDLMIQGIASEIVLVDINKKKALMVVQCGDLTVDGFSLPMPFTKQANGQTP